MHHPLHHLEFTRFLRRPSEHDHCRPGDLAPLLEADIHPGDVTHRAEPILALHPSGQAPLQGDGLAWRQVPVVEGSE